MDLKTVKRDIFHRPNNDKIGISCGWGWREYVYNGKTIKDFHYGIDYATNGKNYVLYPIRDGKVVATGKDNISGNYIFIKYPTLGFISFYCHLKDKPLVKKGDNVTKDTKVGFVGSTGASTGPHLHLGIKKTRNYKDNDFSNWVNPENVVIDTIKNARKTTNFRKKPTLNSKILFKLEKNEAVKEIIRNYRMEDNLMWDKVERNRQIGFVASKNLKAHK